MTRTLAVCALGGIALAMVLAVAGHLDPDPSYDPLTLTISDYAVSDRGGALDAAIVTLAAASLALLLGLHAVRAPVRALPAALMLVWVGGLLASAAVPTDPIGARMSLAGLVHRYVSVSAFVCLPLAGMMLSHRFGRDRRWRGTAGPIRLFALTSGVGLALMCYVAFPGDRALLGLVERLLVVAELALLWVLALRLRRVAAVPHAPAPATASDARELTLRS